jgi:type II pantothenate kinase
MIIGIDIGGSTTDIVGLEFDTIIDPISIVSDNPISSASGALGSFLSKHGLQLNSIEHISATGVGANKLPDTLFSIPVQKIDEFTAIGSGGAYLAGINSAIVTSMGTGTAIIQFDNGKSKHWGGSGVGGGTLTALAQQLLGTQDFDSIIQFAKSGNLENVDLKVGDLADDGLHGLGSDLTASNFGKLKGNGNKNDLALGLINMILQTIAVLSFAACRSENIETLILTGKLTTLPQVQETFSKIGQLYSKNHIIPELSSFATAIGAALHKNLED